MVPASAVRVVVPRVEEEARPSVGVEEAPPVPAVQDVAPLVVAREPIPLAVLAVPVEPRVVAVRLLVRVALSVCCSKEDCVAQTDFPTTVAAQRKRSERGAARHGTEDW